MKTSRSFLIVPLLNAALAIGLSVGASSAWAATTNDVKVVFTNLVNGRAYLADFPTPKTRTGLVNDFLGENGQTPNRPALRDAIQGAIAIREDEPPEPDSFPAGQAPFSIQAKVLAWEALESLLTGYLYAGNRDLLEALRVTYPSSSPANDTRQRPAEEPTEFAGTSQEQITYARLYFLQGIKDVLEYIAEDPTGQLRASGTTSLTMPHYVAFDDASSELLPFPDFDDPNFSGPEASQSVAYLYGSAMERLGLAAVAYADQLWRSAFAGPGAGLKRPEAAKTQMLQRADEVLQENIHAQFLASLPLAAQLGDGSDGNQNEYQLAKINQTRVSVTDALRLREKILAGEKPTQLALVSAWDPVSLQDQITRCTDTHAAAAAKWEQVESELAADEEALTKNAERELHLRNALETQLLDLTGIDPGLYRGLRTESDRRAYLEAITNKFAVLINAQNPNAPGLSDGNLMSIQALRLIQAMREAVAKRAEVDGFPHRMRIELKRNQDENATILVNGVVYEAIELAIGAAGAAPSISVCACGLASGTTTDTKLSALAEAAQAALRVMRQATETVTINSINSEAVISNLLIDQQIAIEELQVVVLNAAIAGAELRQLLATTIRLVEDHIFFQEIDDTLWYRDPSLAFRLETVEEEYRDLLQEYRIELYKLARMLEAAWTERFMNPVKQSNGSTIQPLDNGSFDEFTEAESVFGVGNHAKAHAFFVALKAWNTKLRDPLYRGGYQPQPWDANSFSGQPISLRRDILGFIDYRYDFDSNQYEKDEALERWSIQRFRAYLLDLASRDPVNVNAGSLRRLRIDFPLTYNQARVILGQQNRVPIIRQNRPAGSIDQFWNHRISQLGIRIVGHQVFAAGITVPVSFELFGNVDRIGFFPDSLYTSSRTIATFQVPLYQRDPDNRLVGEPFFGTGIGIPAAIGSAPLPMNSVTGWPLFCDNLVLRIDAQGTMRLENIEDIEFYIQMEVGSPPPINWP